MPLPLTKLEQKILIVIAALIILGLTGMWLL